jgi:predicted acetyltransferase
MAHVELTPAKTTDIERLIAIHASSFPDARGHNERRANFMDNARGSLTDLFVARDGGGGIVGHGFLFSMRTHIEGAPIKVGGVASLGVAPEARGHGVGRQMVRLLLEESARRGDAMQLLYPFSYAYYASLGFGATRPLIRLRTSPASLPHRDEAARCRRAGPDDRAAIGAGYHRAARHGCGMLDRSEALTTRLLSLTSATTFFVPREDATSGGHVTFAIVDAASRGGVAGELEMDVRELCAFDANGRRALYGLLAAHRDQVRALEITVDVDDPLPQLVAEAWAPGARIVPQHLHPLGRVAAGPMVRAVDLRALLTARGYLGQGALDVVVTDPLRGDTSFHLVVKGGAAKIVEHGGGARLSTDIAIMSSIAVGALPPSGASAHGLAKLEGDPAAADALFATRTPFRCHDEF